jgi:hypothetical protein
VLDLFPLIGSFLQIPLLFERLVRRFLSFFFLITLSIALFVIKVVSVIFRMKLELTVQIAVATTMVSAQLKIRNAVLLLRQLELVVFTVLVVFVLRLKWLESKLSVLLVVGKTLRLVPIFLPFFALNLLVTWLIFVQLVPLLLNPTPTPLVVENLLL